MLHSIDIMLDFFNNTVSKKHTYKSLTEENFFFVTPYCRLFVSFSEGISFVAW